MDNSGKVLLELRGIAAGYGGTPVLREVSFTVPKGSLTALIGPNGCGKTTLLRAAARQLPLLAGEILLDGRAVSSRGCWPCPGRTISPGTASSP